MCQQSFFILLEMLYRYMFRPFCWVIFRRTQYKLFIKHQALKTYGGVEV
jgi:hypothetical protein